MLPNTEPTAQTDKDGSGNPSIADRTLDISQRFHTHELLPALQAMRAGDFSVRISGDWIGIEDTIADTFNKIAAANERMAQQLERVGQCVSKEGETKQRVCFGLSSGAWGEMESSINTMVDQLNTFASEVTRVGREVDHRAKNALAVVQSIVRLTRANTIEEFTAAVEGRIRSLSLAHTILSLSRWQGADLSGLVEEELAPYRADGAPKITTSGPNVSLWPAAAQCLALALHELVTNAAKYGALSSATGSVGLEWSTASGNLVLRWTEKGGPPSSAPSAPGFGMRIIRASIEGQLAGATAFDWRADGVRCELTVPLLDRKLVHATTNGQHPPRSQTASAQRPIAVSGNRILVVEDEALVAIAIREALEELGYVVVGPCNRITEAMVALRHNRVDAAVLDVNLGDVSVYPLADILVAESIPFIFVTGYGTEELDRRFLTVPVLQKPIERHALQTIFAQSPKDRSQPRPAPLDDAVAS